MISKRPPCVVPPAPMNQGSRLLGQGGIHPFGFTQEDREILTSAKQRPYLQCKNAFCFIMCLGRVGSVLGSQQMNPVSLQKDHNNQSTYRLSGMVSHLGESIDTGN